MQQDILKKFKEFDYTKNENWIKFYKDLYPTPSLKVLEKKKRYWYKKNIDSNFNPEYDLIKEDNKQTYSNITKTDYKNDKLYKLEGIIKIFYFILAMICLPIKSVQIAHIIIGLLACFLSIKRQMKVFEFKKEFLIKVLYNDYGLLIFYFIFLIFIDKSSLLFHLPVMSLFLIAISNFAILSNIKILNKYEKLRNLWNGVITYKSQVIRARCYIEFILFFYTIILIFCGSLSIFTILLLFSYIKFRNMLNVQFSNMMYHNKSYLISKFNNQLIIKIINMIFSIF